MRRRRVEFAGGESGGAVAPLADQRPRWQLVDPRRGRRVGGLTIAALIAVSLSGFVGAAPAYADTTATVKVRTQRMSDANLGSQQNGWYNAGDHVTLACSKRGQPVKGFFSFNIPGGWDTLWYKTSDGNFVADVDIETGTLNDVAPDCGDGGGGGAAPAASPAQSSSRADAAVARAMTVVGSNYGGVYGCIDLVQFAYNIGPTGDASPLVMRDRLGGAQAGVPPKGALVFSQSDADIINGQHYGHVVLARGDGTYISGGVSNHNGAGPFVQVLSTPNLGHWTDLGWIMPPW